MFGADLAVVDALILGPHVLDDQTPLVHALVVVHADPRVPHEREQADGEGVLLVMSAPGHLSHRQCGYGQTRRS